MIVGGGVPSTVLKFIGPFAAEIDAGTGRMTVIPGNNYSFDSNVAFALQEADKGWWHFEEGAEPTPPVPNAVTIVLQEVAKEPWSSTHQYTASTFVVSQGLPYVSLTPSLNELPADHPNAWHPVGLSIVPSTEGSNNVVLGEEAGEFLTSSQTGDVLIGNSAGEHLKGNFNTFIGNHAGKEASTADSNVVIGSGAADEGTFSGKQNVIVGTEAVENIGTGSGNVVIGYEASLPSTATNNRLVITNNNSTSVIEGVMSATVSEQELGFFGTAPHRKPEVTGGTVTAKQLAEALQLLGLVKVN